MQGRQNVTKNPRGIADFTPNYADFDALWRKSDTKIAWIGVGGWCWSPLPGSAVQRSLRA